MEGAVLTRVYFVTHNHWRTGEFHPRVVSSANAHIDNWMARDPGAVRARGHGTVRFRAFREVGTAIDSSDPEQCSFRGS
jgi:hypothetical protein